MSSGSATAAAATERTIARIGHGRRRARTADDLDRAGRRHVTAPVRPGFGSRLIERSARDQLGGEATVDFLPHGVVVTVTCTLEDAS